jgi:putative hydrolase of the HAD superfamily
VRKRPIEAVLFDLGETLLTFGRLDRNQVSVEASRRAYDYLKELHQPVGSFGTYRLFHLWGIRWQVFKSWLTGRDFNSLEVLKQFGRNRGLTLSDEQWQEMNWRWYESLSVLGKIVPGSVAALQQLSEMGLKLGLLSNTFVHKTSLERHMAEEGLLDYLPVRMYSYEFLWRKPDARLFTAAAERIGVAPEKIVYVGDRIDFDVNGSRKAGMLPILRKAYTNENRTPPPGVECIQDNTELVDAILRQCDVPAPSVKTKPNKPVYEQG